MVKIILGDIEFDVNQTEISVSQENKPYLYTLANGSQMVSKSLGRLKTVEFSGWFTNIKNYIALSNMLKSGEARNLIVTGINVPINMYVVIENFRAVERGGDISVIEYKVKFREYITQKIRVIDSKVSTKTEMPQTVFKPSTYTIKKGDTLWEISKRYYGQGERYTEIANKNNIKNPNLIKVGQVIVL